MTGLRAGEDGKHRLITDLSRQVRRQFRRKALGRDALQDCLKCQRLLRRIRLKRLPLPLRACPHPFR